MTRLFAMGVVVFALTGCGTVGNFTDRSAYPQIYGGVDLAVKGIKNESRDVEFLVTWPFQVADVALSAVADTLTLPIAIPLAIHGGYMDYYFPKPGSRRSSQIADSQPTPVVPPTASIAP